MIKAEYDYNAMELTMTGHAGAEKVNGYDLVCCSASVLLYTLIWSCKAYPGMIRNMEYRAEPGDAHIKIEPNPESYEPILHRYESCLEGLHMLQQQYPDCIQVSGI